MSKPFDEGLELEREAFVTLMATPESRALRHVFTAERAAAKVPTCRKARRCARSARSA